MLRTLLFWFASFLAISLSAQSFAAAPIDTVSHIKVVGIGQVTAIPDQAELTLRFAMLHLELDEARRTVDQRVTALTALIDDYDIKANSLDTSQLSVQPRYDYRPNNQRHFIGFDVNRQVQFTLSRLDQLDALVETLSSSKLTGLDHIRFSHSAPEQMQNQALEKAIIHSQSLAKQIATAYGRKLGKVHQVDVKRSATRARPQHMEARTTLLADSGTPTYRQKEQIFEAQVNATFLLE